MTWVKACLLQGDDDRLLEGEKNHTLYVCITYTISMSVQDFHGVEMRGRNVLQDSTGSNTEIKGYKTEG